MEGEPDPGSGAEDTPRPDPVRSRSEAEAPDASARQPPVPADEPWAAGSSVFSMLNAPLPPNLLRPAAVSGANSDKPKKSKKVSSSSLIPDSFVRTEEPGTSQLCMLHHRRRRRRRRSDGGCRLHHLRRYPETRPMMRKGRTWVHRHQEAPQINQCKTKGPQAGPSHHPGGASPAAPRQTGMPAVPGGVDQGRHGGAATRLHRAGSGTPARP